MEFVPWGESHIKGDEKDESQIILDHLYARRSFWSARLTTRSASDCKKAKKLFASLRLSR